MYNRRWFYGYRITRLYILTVTYTLELGTEDLNISCIYFIFKVPRLSWRTATIAAAANRTQQWQWQQQQQLHQRRRSVSSSCERRMQCLDQSVTRTGRGVYEAPEYYLFGGKWRVQRHPRVSIPISKREVELHHQRRRWERFRLYSQNRSVPTSNFLLNSVFFLFSSIIRLLIYFILYLCLQRV